MLKRILIVWVVANFVIVGIVCWAAGGWYIGWPVSPAVRALAELGLILVPNLVLPILALRYWWPERIESIRDALGWRWNGWRSFGAGILGFAVWFGGLEIAVRLLGNSIPYNLPGDAGGGSPITIHGLSDVLMVLGVLLGLAALVAVTVAGEETMFRGLAQTQLGKRYGIWAGLLIAALLFGLRHLPADFFYADIWHATPQMWLSRQVQLYLTAVCLGLVRHFGKSTYSSAIMHGLIYLTAIFGLG